MTHSAHGLGSSFWRLWAATVGSRFGDKVRVAALALLAASETHNAVVIALVAASSYAPWLLLGPISGAIADRLSRKKLFVTTELGRGALQLAFAGLVASGGVHSPWLLIVVAFLLGCAQTLSDSCFSGLLRVTISEENMLTGNVHLSVARSLAGRFLGIPVGALLFSVSRPLPFAVDSATFFLAAFLVLSLGNDATRLDEGPLNARAVLRDAAYGVRWMAGESRIRAYVFTVGLMNLAGSALQATLVVYALYALHVSGDEYGLLGGAAGLATVAGNMGSSYLGRRLSLGEIAAGAVACQIVGFVILVCAPGFSVACGGMVFVGLGTGIWNVVTTTEIMKRTPPELMSRILGAQQVVAMGAAPVGAVLGGGVAASVGTRAPAGGGAVLELLALVVLVRHLVNSRRSLVVQGAVA